MGRAKFFHFIAQRNAIYVRFHFGQWTDLKYALVKKREVFNYYDRPCPIARVRIVTFILRVGPINL